MDHAIPATFAALRDLAELADAAGLGWSITASDLESVRPSIALWMGPDSEAVGDRAGLDQAAPVLDGFEVVSIEDHSVSRRSTVVLLGTEWGLVEITVVTLAPAPEPTAPDTAPTPAATGPHDPLDGCDACFEEHIDAIEADDDEDAEATA